MPREISRRRMCGASRVIGGCYWELGTEEAGQVFNVDRYIVDPPMEINPERFGLTAIGVKVIEVDGVVHIMDWVGELHYPNVADFIEEARALGFSRRVPRNSVPFERLTAESRLLLVHRKAIIIPGENGFSGWNGTPMCPMAVREGRFHPNLETCSRFWYADVLDVGVRSGGMGMRRLPCGAEYRFSGARADSQHSPGIFASVPLGRIAVVADQNGGRRHEPAVARISRTNVEWSLTGE